MGHHQMSWPEWLAIAKFSYKNKIQTSCLCMPITDLIHVGDKTVSRSKSVRKTLKLNSLFFSIYFRPREPKCDSKRSQTNHGNNISHTCNYSTAYVPVCVHPCSTIKHSKIYVI